MTETIKKLAAIKRGGSLLTKFNEQIKRANKYSVI